MKKIFSILVILLVMSCTDLTDLNKNLKDPAIVNGEFLFTSGQKNLFDQVITTDVNLNPLSLFMQYFTQTTYTDESNYDLADRTIPDNHWDEIYRRSIKNFMEAYSVLESSEILLPETEQIRENKKYITEILIIYAYSVLVDTFSNIPYSEALQDGLLSPKYDDALTIYKDLISRLNVAINGLDDSSDSFSAGADNVYQGDVKLWLKFANSLKLRMGITLSDVTEEAALVKETIESAAAASLLSSNADNTAIKYIASTPNTNPLHAGIVLSGRKDYVATSPFIDKLISLNDPRLPFYFVKAEGKEDYKGGGVGDGNKYADFSHINPRVTEATFEGTIIDYAEVEFLLAEAVERGYAVPSGSAEDHYNNAITASIEYWSESDDDVATYLAQPEVAYTTATGDWKEKIGIQKWIALYNRGFAAWNSWKLLDYPELTPASQAVSVIPRRYTYPIEEQTLNGKSHAAAAAVIGGDNVETKIFWDKN